jgi:outer membrane protein assembly factor BamB
MKKFSLSFIAFLIISLFYPQMINSQSVVSKNWNQFRGYNRDGIISDLSLKADWFKSEPELLWKKKIGQAFSEVVIYNNMLFTMFSEKTDSISGEEFIAAYNSETGEEIWRTKVDSIFIDVDGWGDGPRSTPAVDEKIVFCFSGNGKLSALDKKNGNLIWQRDFVAEYGSAVPRWGYSASPLILKDKIIMEVGGANGKAFAAFDKATGDLIWAKANGVASYSSPVLFEIEGTEQIIFANSGVLYSFNENGEELWKYKLPIRPSTALPVLLDSNKIFVSALGAVGFVILQVQQDSITELIQSSTMKNDYSSSSFLNGYIYGFNVAALQCISPITAEKLWVKRGFGKGSFIIINDKLVVLSDQGKIIYIEADNQAYKEVNSFQALEGKCWTAPSYVNGRLYVRNLTEMACYKINQVKKS